MVVNVHAGHNPDGKIACGAVGLIKESTEARRVKDLVIQKLQALGHTVYDCTCDNGTGQNDVLRKIVAKCNAHKVDLDVSIHFNSGRNDYKGDGSIGGTEVWVYPSGSPVEAQDTVNAIAELGFRNRGVKASKDLYFLSRTNAKAMLVECCFVDDADDTKLYNADAMANAIVKGITKHSVVIQPTQPVSQATTTSAINNSFKVKVTASALNVRSGAGTNFPRKTVVHKNEVYTIVEEKNGWGRLKSGAGWISLAYTVRV